MAAKKPPAKKSAAKKPAKKAVNTVGLDEKPPHVRRKAGATTVAAKAGILAREAKVAGKQANKRGSSWA